MENCKGQEIPGSKLVFVNYASSPQETNCPHCWLYDKQPCGEPCYNKGFYIDMDDDMEEVYTSSWVADMFDKKHRYILDEIEKLNYADSGLSDKFLEKNYSLRTNEDGKSFYVMTQAGLTALAAGFSGERTKKLREMLCEWEGDNA